ncbi:MAG: dTMP kinase [Gammaproteobacteria bacterium]|jgi:dTMP kinase|nr:dTMP kinase [Gammaproteobacteria bacterium]
MIVIDGIDGSGKGVQSRRLLQIFLDAGESAILTREPGGSPAAEDIRRLLVKGEPQKWDDMTELLLMYAARRSHLRDTIWPALAENKWVISDRYADSSRAFQGIAGNLGLDTVERIHRLVVGDFEPALVIILDLPETIALARTEVRGDDEDRFERKGQDYHSRVRAAFRQIAATNPSQYRLIDADRDIAEVGADITQTINAQFALQLTSVPATR